LALAFFVAKSVGAVQPCSTCFRVIPHSLNKKNTNYFVYINHLHTLATLLLGSISKRENQTKFFEN